MKKFTFKGVLDGFRSSVQQQAKPEQEIQEILKPDHFTLIKTFRHGFPHSPTSLAYDPIQKLLVIGDKSGSLRILGRPGVDVHVRHDGDSACAVTHIIFLVNEGALVTATADDTLHLWNFRQKSPQVVQSLKFARERISCIFLPVSSKWLYVGTDKGNVHVVHIESFALSGYIINWNKAIEVLMKTHPGCVVQLCDNPLDSNRLLIAFECGQIVLWDLRGKVAEMRWQSAEPLRSVSWHHEGKQFISSHTDGSICTWPLRPTPQPQSHSFPHAKTLKSGKLEQCKPIHKVELKTSRNGETYTIFSGGLSMEKGGKSPCITVLQGKATTVLEMEHPVVDFVTICESPWASDMQEPYAIAVLLQNDIVLIDLLSPGFPCFESPYPMDLHESPVTCCSYLADCPSDLVPAFYSVGRSSSTRRSGISDRDWPISGGEWSPASCSYSEIIITGHQDGSLKFWDASAGTLQILYKLKTAKIFEKPKTRSLDGTDEDPLAIQLISLCPESRRLCVAGASGHVVLFKFKKSECTSEILVLEIPISYENFDEGETSPECEFIPRSLPKQTESTDSDKKNECVLKIRLGPQRKPQGFQAQLVCVTPWTNSTHPGQIMSLAINSSYGLMAYGTEHGLVVIDIIQKVCLLNVASPDLYGAQDPYSRVPRSPKRVETSQYNKDDQARSPSIDQLADLSSSPQKSMMPSSSALPSTSLPAESISYSASASSSRPVSPAQEAMESMSPPDDIISPEEIAKIKSAQNRRKSSAWKAFSIKRQISKVDMKLKKTFGDAGGSVVGSVGGSSTGIEKDKATSVFYTMSNVDKAQLSPVEMSPDTETNSTPTDNDQDKSDYLVELEKDIVKSLNDLDYKDSSPIDPGRESRNSNSDVDSDPTNMSPSQSNLFQNPSDKMKKVGFIEPACTKIDASPGNEGALISRPSDLPIQDSHYPSDYPNPPPRTKKAQRLLSVPNIKTYATVSQPTAVQKPDMRDLRGFNRKVSKNDGQATSSSFAGSLMRRFSRKSSESNPLHKRRDVERSCSPLRAIWYKLDNSFSRSRSSSMSSLENISSEAIQCLAFTDSYTKKSDPSVLIPTLWVGTTLGSVLTVSITLPDLEFRKTQPVLVSILGGPIFRLKGAILSMSFLDCNGALIPYSYESWRDEGKSSRDIVLGTPTKNTNRMSPTLSGSGGDTFGDRQFIVITSEKQARVVALPSQNCVYRLQISDTDYAVKAEIVSLKDSVCLVCYISTGHLLAYTLPSLKPLLDVDFLPLADLRLTTVKSTKFMVSPHVKLTFKKLLRFYLPKNKKSWTRQMISKTFCFSNKGHGLYLATPTELQKFTMCAEFGQFFGDMIAELFFPRDMPEQPKESFFKGLFGGGVRFLDREELFGEQSGKASRSVAKHIPGPSMDQLGQRSSAVASEISRAHQMVVERGDKLNQLEDRTERMSNQAQEFSSSAHQLMLKYKDKKWYQL